MAGRGSTCVGVGVGVGIDRQSSIEFEPRTLDFRQIQFAREAAQYVMNTKSMEEAFKIFTQGLEPVTSVCSRGDNGAETEMEEEEEDFNYVMVNQLIKTTSDRCRDVSTAPF